MMDYAHQARVKLWGRARVDEVDTDLMAKLAGPSYRARVERAIMIEIDAWSENCQQHIPQRFDSEDVAPVIEALQSRIALLEAENVRLRASTSSK
jgi:uncharacterized protein